MSLVVKNVKRLKIYYLKIDKNCRSVIGTSFKFAPRNLKEMIVEKGKSLRMYVIPTSHIFKMLYNIKDLYLDHLVTIYVLSFKQLELFQCFPPSKVV